MSGAPSPRELTHRGVLALAVPVMLSNASTPLIGLVDTAVVGQIPDPAHIGAVAIGALIFGFVFWTFSSLRMGTTGLTAQAFGAGDRGEIAASLHRALLAAAVIGVLLLVLQWPIQRVAFGLLGASEEVEALARSYFDIRIWSAPATLANYALLGWFIGLGRTDTGLVLQLVLNVTNIALALLLGLVLGWGVPGVAAAAVFAEFVAVAVGLVVARRWLAREGSRAEFTRILDPVKLRRVVGVNADIMIRTLAMIGIVVWFVQGGATQSDATLAANALLLNCISIAAFFLDGIAFAAESLVGRAVGAARRAALLLAVKLTTIWAVAIAAVISLVMFAAGPATIDMLTVDAVTRLEAREYLVWAACVPLVGVWAFQLDGIFIGATRTTEMRNAALATLALYLAVAWALAPFGNHGLWAALTFSYFARAGTLLWFYPKLVRSVPA
jgi:MATE family multidrug resistance protein